ncbi:MAG: SIMPL domain-containing protein [Pseudomonadota bacterium]
MKKLSLVGAALSGLVSLACTTVHPVIAGDVPNTLTVIGTGEASGAPDIARLTLGVEARSTNPEQAMNDASRKMDAVIQVLQRAGVKPDDIQTSNFNIHTEERSIPLVDEDRPVATEGAPGAAGAGVSSREIAPAKGPAPVPPPAPPQAPPDAPGREQRVLYYVATNSVSVVLRDLPRVGKVLGEVVQAGVNHAWGIQFERENPEPLVAEAGAKAIVDAKQRAAVLAQQGGVRLGRVLSIAEGGGAPVSYGYARESGIAMRAMAVDAPIEPGQVRVRQNVRVTFALE